ncbi:uracil-DNA glycosylase [Haloplanus aerogenes]|uniref:Uracil-DNA glycosylase n=1 Tax=Haloplanus aerogenes TaxID=660522 RepID=A0A3M0CVL8_9EURY|nr:uracil-DNA glycosylase [Haloplanus aerogenes]AZH23880.1 uracil-DNA glycosylase [Haloplanus aerogenes]RMB13361.1 uracil-DNA glycosylase family 4 [Haloplanus aerogenes]
MSDPTPEPPALDDALVLAPDCRRCPALADARDRIAWGNGPRDADVMVVGEAPAAGDPDDPEWPGGNRSGLAYTSRHSGRRIRSLLAAVGIDDAFYTNAVKCFPPDGEGSNREPTPEERSNCRDHLRAELDAVGPTVVLPTGKHATTTLLVAEGRELDGFLDHVLDPVDAPTLGATVIPLLHPSYADVWRSRLGYDRDSYRAALAAALRSCGVDATD